MKKKGLYDHSLRAFPGDGPVQGVRVVELPSVGHLRVAFVADLDRHRRAFLGGRHLAVVVLDARHAADVQRQRRHAQHRAHLEEHQNGPESIVRREMERERWPR